MNKFSSITIVSLVAGFALTFFAVVAAQQQQPAQQRQAQPMTVNAVKDTIYEVKGGSGANTGFIVTDKEVFAIDAKMSEDSAHEMLAAIKKATDKPLTTIIITHSDGDHVNGLVGFPPGLNIIAHTNTRKHMEAAFPQEQHALLPNITFTDKMTINSGNTVLELYYFGPAHTDGDIVIYCPAEKLAFIGDLIFIGRDPLIHKHKSGSSFGSVEYLNSLLKLDVDTFLHGHGDVADRETIKGFIAEMQKKQDKIKEMIEQGKSLDEVKKVFNVKDQPPRSGRSPRPSLVEIIYNEILEMKK